MTDDELAKQIGANVRRVRLSRGMTQDALSKATGIAVPHISRLEKGGPPPNVATVRKVAEALDVPICRLIDPPDAPPPKRAPKPRQPRPPAGS